MHDKYYEINKTKYDREASAMVDVNRRAAFTEAYAKIRYLTPKEFFSVLDVGCGTGNLRAALGECVVEYLGIDISTEALRMHDRGASKSGVHRG